MNNFLRFGILLAACVSLAAQTIVTGEIAGTVKDPSGGAVPNVSVKATNAATGEVRTATSNAAGGFRFPILTPGAYTLSATASGFQPAEVKATASLGQVSTFDINLSVAQTATTLEVVAEAAPLLQAENANVASSLNITQLENLPIAGNDMAAYAYSAPGITMSTGAGYGSFTAFGLPATSNLFTINGTDYMDPYLNLNNSGASNLSLGANEIQEAAIVTNGYTGQYGRQAGAQINYVTKSGTNAFHGDAIWYWNGTKLNANDFFNNSTFTDRPHAVSNQWATGIGGPIKKNKLFFNWDYEGIRYVLPSGGPVYLPTAAFASATLTHLNATNPSAVPFYTKAFGVYAGSPSIGRAVPVTKSLDDALGCGDLQGTLGAFGVTAPCAVTFQQTDNSLNTEWLSGERADFNATDKDHFYFRAWTDRGLQATSTDPINKAFSANSLQPQWSTQLGYTRVISPQSVNELLLSGFYYSAKFGPPDFNAAVGVFPTTWEFGDGLYSNLGGVNTAVFPNFPSGRKVSQWQIVDDYAYNHAAHSFKAGINFRRNDVGSYAYGPNTQGTMIFNSMTDFYNGMLTPDNGDTYSQNFTRVGAEHIGLYSVGFYGQDQWKVRRNLTVTLAIRFERSQNPSCGRNCFDRPATSFTEVDHSASTPYNSTIQLGLGSAFRNLDAIVAQPRVGIAYSLGAKTVIRGGFGIFADQFQGNLADRFFTNTPNVASFTTSSGVAAPGVPNSAFTSVANSNAALQSGFANGATLAQLKAAVPGGFTIPNLFTQVDNFHVPRYAEWNIEVQREIVRNVDLSVNYVGHHGWDQYNQYPFLNAYSTSGFGGLPTAPLDTRFGEILELQSTGYANYEGLTTSVRWRRGSFVGAVNYTWSHDLDTCSNNCLGRFNLGGAGADSLRYNVRTPGAAGSYGSADYDIRHSLSANYLWTIPTYFKSNVVGKRVLGGWSVGGTFIAHSSYPLSVVNSSLRSTYIKNSSGVATIAALPTWLSGTPGSCTGPDVACLTKSEFAKTAAQSTFGNLARNSFRGPGYFDTDLSINKNILNTERFKFVLGANFFNVLNHPNFDLPINNLALGNFGEVVETVSPPSSAYGAFQGSSVSGRVVVLNTKFQF